MSKHRHHKKVTHKGGGRKHGKTHANPHSLPPKIFQVDTWTNYKDGQPRPDTGYYATTPYLPAEHFGNAFLQYRSTAVGLFVYEIQASFELSGTFGQSALTQDFYPHNLVAPSVTVSCQYPNTFEKNKVAKFLRHVHIHMIKDAQDNNGEKVRLHVLNNTGGVQPDADHATIKGSHYPIDIYGVVESIDFGAERFQNAGEFQFQFIIMKGNGWLGLNDTVQDGPNQNIQNVTGFYSKARTANWEFYNDMPSAKPKKKSSPATPSALPRQHFGGLSA